MKKTHKKLLILSLSAILAVSSAIGFSARADEVPTDEITETADSEVQKVVTEYSDLWTGFISFKAGEPVQWYVHVPEDTEPRGCGSNVVIPSLDWSTGEETEVQVKLTKGDNFIYEFNPKETGDYLFNCSMGSGCHYNYIHVTEDGTFTAEKPADPVNIHAERNGSTISVSFDAPETAENVHITGYRVTATDDSGKRSKKTVEENSAVFENLNAESGYKIKVYTLSTSGTSAGENETSVEAEAAAVTTAVTTDSASETATTITESTAAAESAAATTTAESTKNTTATTAKTTEKTTAAETAAKNNTSSPKTGDSGSTGAVAALIASFGISLVIRKRNDNY